MTLPDPPWLSAPEEPPETYCLGCGDSHPGELCEPDDDEDEDEEEACWYNLELERYSDCDGKFRCYCKELKNDGR